MAEPLYAYAALSRRAGGVSIGVNVSTTHECSWRCVDCHVAELGRGALPTVDLAALEDEQRAWLDALVTPTRTLVTRALLSGRAGGPQDMGSACWGERRS